MNKNYVAVQGNRLVEARHKKPLSSREQKIILTMVSMIKEKDEDFKEYVISIKSFHEMLGLGGDPNYTQLKEVIENLMSKTIEIQRDNGGWLLTHWLSTAEYIKGEGALRLKFVPELKPYLLDLKTHFTAYRLTNILSLKSTYSIRLYELMKRWEYLGKWTIEVDELKRMMGAQIASFERYNLFKTRAIEVAIKELNKKTDIHIDFKEIRNGRKVEKIEFSIRKSSEVENKKLVPPSIPEKDQENDSREVKSRLNKITKGYSFDDAYFNQLYQGAQLIWDQEAENQLYMLVNYVNDETSITNPLGFIKSKLQTAWTEHNEGILVTFASLKPSRRSVYGREEIIPDWFKKTQDSKVNKSDFDVTKEREILIEEMRDPDDSFNGKK